MAKIPGLGEMLDGVLERDPLNEGYQIRFPDSLGLQRVVSLNDVLAEYVGKEVRFTVAYSDALTVALNRAHAADVNAVSFEDLEEKEG